jgi:hypothetical protein
MNTTATVARVMSLLIVAILSACGGPSNTFPTPNNPGPLTASDVTSDSLVLEWAPAVGAGADHAAYAVYQSTSDNIGTVGECQRNGTWLHVTEFLEGRVSALVTGLQADTTYYFNVVVLYPSGAKATYPTFKQATLTPDVTVPVPGAGGAISASSVSAESLVLHWAAATDDKTVQPRLSYAVYRSTSSPLTTVAECEGNGTLLQVYQDRAPTTLYLNGLAADTAYYFNVVVEDRAGNKSAYRPQSQPTSTRHDASAPVPANAGNMEISDVTTTSLVLSWPAAVDDLADASDLRYAVCMSLWSNITTAADCNDNGTLVSDFAANMLTTTVANLVPDRTYYFNVVVQDPAGNRSSYYVDLATTAPVEPECPGGSDCGCDGSGDGTTTDCAYRQRAGRS